MKLTYTGSHEELSSKQRQKVETKLGKVSKMLDRRGEKEAHVILKQERFLHCAEITVNAYDHALVGVGSDGDLFTAICSAVDKLEKQVLKMRTKWRDTHRHTGTKEKVATAAPAVTEVAEKKVSATSRKKSSAAAIKTPPQVFRVNHQDGRKPMTLEEAMLEMGASQDYLVYRDAKTDRVSVLMRRGDGHLDLIES